MDFMLWKDPYGVCFMIVKIGNFFFESFPF